MTHNNNTSRENKMTKKTQEQLRQEGLRAARNMVRKFKAREKARKNNNTKGNTVTTEFENVDREDEWNTNWQNDTEDQRATMSLCECEACNG